MRKILISLTACSLLLGATSCKEDIISTIVNGVDTKTGDVKVGDTLPDFGSVVLTSGRSFSRSSLKGKTSLLAFYSLKCTDCQEELPVLEDVYEYIQDYQISAATNGESFNGINFYTVSRDDSEDEIETYWNENGFEMPTAADQLAYYYFASSVVPRIYISNSENVVTHVFTDANMPSYKELLSALGFTIGDSDDDDDEGWSDDSGKGTGDVDFTDGGNEDVGGGTDSGSGDTNNDDDDDDDDDDDWPDLEDCCK